MSFLHVVPIRDDTVHDKGAQYIYPALISILPWAGGSAATVVGACDPEVTHQGSLRGHHATQAATHIRAKTPIAFPLVLGTFAIDLLAQDHRSKV